MTGTSPHQRRRIPEISDPRALSIEGEGGLKLVEDAK